MTNERDVERDCRKTDFVAALRRCADDLEAGRSHRIQIVNKRFTIPAEVELSIEHEIEDGVSEVEFQLKWRT